MDDGGQKSRRGIPQLSRIPLPHSTFFNNVNTESHHENSSSRLSHIPRPSGTSLPRLREKKPFIENADEFSKPHYGYSVLQARDKSPVRDQLQSTQITSLDITPPKSNNAFSVEGDENSIADGREAKKQQRKPRPSLSERTLETLSQIPPSPARSPSRRRPSVVSGTNFAATPSKFGSSLRLSQSNASLRGQLMSPVKPIPRPASRIGLPSRTNVQLYDLPGHQSTQKALKVDEIPTRITLPKTSYRNRPSLSPTKVRSESRTQAPSKIFNHGQPNNPLDHKESDLKPRVPVSALKASSKPKPAAPKSTQPPRIYPELNAGKRASALKPNRGNVGLSNSTGAKLALSLPSVQSGNDNNEAPLVDNKFTQQHFKSSLTLRETIARAKAAKKEVKNQSIDPMQTGDDIVAVTLDFDVPVEDYIPEHGERGLQRRIDGAVTSGTLNIAAMGLKNLPKEIKRMYDFDPDSKSSWSEAVDLTKLIIADNELTELPDSFFPDWSIEELEADEDKSNQFGGLQTLDLRGNYLAKIPIGLRRLQQLRVLNLSNNKLGLDVFEAICQIPNLRELTLSNNQMKGSVPRALVRLTELHVLDLHGNQLSMLPDDVSVLQNLQVINISDNKFNTVPIISLQRLPLTELNMSKNALAGTLAQGSLVFAELQVLNVASNRLERLCNGRFDLPKLQSLICDSNQLTSLPDLSLLGSLKALTASENKILDLPESFASVKSLHSVDLSGNEIKTLHPSIAKLENLTTLNITANPLREPKFLAMSTDSLKAELSKRVEGFQFEVDVSNSNHEFQYSDDFQGVADHTKYKFKPINGVLDLSSQHLSVVNTSAIDLSRSIHTIRLSNNSLTHLPLDILNHPNVQSSLQVLDMSHNPLLNPTTYVETSLELPALKSLSIVSTGLTSLEALTTHLVAPRLQELNISCHRLSGLVPQLRAYFPSLSTLLATDNWFTSIDVEHIRGLEVVDIRNNHLDHLPPKIGELGNLEGSRPTPGRLRAFECSGNLFRVPRLTVIEKGAEAILKDLRRMIPIEEIGDEWR